MAPDFPSLTYSDKDCSLLLYKINYGLKSFIVQPSGLWQNDSYRERSKLTGESRQNIFLRIFNKNKLSIFEFYPSREWRVLGSHFLLVQWGCFTQKIALLLLEIGGLILLNKIWLFWNLVKRRSKNYKILRIPNVRLFFSSFSGCWIICNFVIFN
jgi:hypothetical protein